MKWMMHVSFLHRIADECIGYVSLFASPLLKITNNNHTSLSGKFSLERHLHDISQLIMLL